MKAPVPEYENSELSRLISNVRRDARKAKDAHRELGVALARLDEYLTGLALTASSGEEGEG